MVLVQSGVLLVIGMEAGVMLTRATQHSRTWRHSHLLTGDFPWVLLFFSSKRWICCDSKDEIGRKSCWSVIAQNTFQLPSQQVLLCNLFSHHWNSSKVISESLWEFGKQNWVALWLWTPGFHGDSVKKLSAHYRVVVSNWGRISQ